MSLGEIPNRRRKNRKAAVIGLIAAGVVLAVALLFDGLLVNFSFGLHGTDLLQLGGKRLTTADAYVLLSDAKKEYENVFTEEVWNTDIGAYRAADYVKEQLRVKMYRLCSMAKVADKRGIVLTREARFNVSKAATEYLNGLTNEQIEQIGVSQEQMESLFETYALAKQLYEDITADLNIEISADAARVISIQYIVTDSLDNANAAVNRLSAGESFAVMVKEYGGSVSGNTTVRRGEMQAVFEEAAFELKAGEVSPVISAGDKYYIIKCVSDNEKTLSEANKIAMINERKLEEFNKIIDTYEAGAFVEISECKWERITIESTPDLGVSFDEIFSKYF